MVIGVTGGLCAGKSLAVGWLRGLGFAEIDVDRLGHAALRECRDRIVERFGRGILAADGTVDRGRLGRIVFADRAALQALEAIVHPVMVAEVERLVAAAPGPTVVNAAILLRMGLERLCDLVVCVRAPWALRLARAMRRDRLSPIAAARRMLAQGRVCPKTGRSDVDIVSVSNCGSRQRLFARLERALRAKGAI